MGGRKWTEEELSVLETMIGTFTVETIAKRLGRSFNAVNMKLNRMGLVGFEKSTDLLTMNQICIMLGVQRRTIDRWQKKGLHIMRKSNYRVVKQQELARYLKEHQEDWNAHKVTDDSLLLRYPWFKEKKKTDVKKNYHWTTTEVARLKFLYRKGVSIKEIAKDMGRSESSVKCKLLYLRRK